MMNTVECLKVLEIVKGFIEITERLRSNCITEECYEKHLKPMLIDFRKFLGSVRFDLYDHINPYEREQLRSEGVFVEEGLNETIKLLEKDIVKDKE